MFSFVSKTRDWDRPKVLMESISDGGACVNFAWHLIASLNLHQEGSKASIPSDQQLREINDYAKRTKELFNDFERYKKTHEPLNSTLQFAFDCFIKINKIVELIQKEIVAKYDLAKSQELIRSAAMTKLIAEKQRVAENASRARESFTAQLMKQGLFKFEGSKAFVVHFHDEGERFAGGINPLFGKRHLAPISKGSKGRGSVDRDDRSEASDPGSRPGSR
jgi:hypothetical protein